VKGGSSKGEKFFELPYLVEIEISEKEKYMTQGKFGWKEE